MAITEGQRIDLVRALEGAMGKQAATTLMEYLPAQGWREVATRSDLANLRVATSAEMATLSSELRGEMATLSSELRGEMATLSSELRGEMAILRSDLRSEMARLTRVLVLTFVTLMVTFGSAVIGAVAALVT